MAIYYISDTHFGHANVIHFDNRPFKDIFEMDRIMIENWNSIVQEDDTVYFLGDFSWYREEETLKILANLNGTKVLIKGNHDKVSPRIAKYFRGVYDYLEVNDDGRRVILSHYPIMAWNAQFRGSIHLYGHVHNTKQWKLITECIKHIKENSDIPMRMYNVGCMMDYMNYMPRTLTWILSKNE